MNTKIGQGTLGELIPIIIILALLFLFVIFCFYMAVQTSKNKNQRLKEQGNNVLDKNASLYTALTHKTGLPIPENTHCKIYSCPGKYVIEANGQTFNLNKEKVTGLNMKADVETHNSYVSSAGGAVGGAMLFGPAGALIGGRTKQKTDKTLHTYLIFTYQKDNSVDYIAFNTTFNKTSLLFIDEFNANHKGINNPVEL